MGKTLEAALLIKHVLEQPGRRALYIAPASLVQNVRNDFQTRFPENPNFMHPGVYAAGMNTHFNDNLTIASIERLAWKARRPNGNIQAFLQAGLKWDIIIVDECHRLSAYGDVGEADGQSTRYRAIKMLLDNNPGAQVVLMSGTPHRGNQKVFENLLDLLREPKDQNPEAHAEQPITRLFWRTKDDVKGWQNEPLFPKRKVNETTIVPLGEAYEDWYSMVDELYVEGGAHPWHKGQALQYVASSIRAGLGYLCRTTQRHFPTWTPETIPELRAALEAIRPYRGRPRDEPVSELWQAIAAFNENTIQLVSSQEASEDSDDAADETDAATNGAATLFGPNEKTMRRVLQHGASLLTQPQHTNGAATGKLGKIKEIVQAAQEQSGQVRPKFLLFAIPVETVYDISSGLRDLFECKVGVITGETPNEQRHDLIQHFKREDDFQFLVSSRAGGEGLNMQFCHRLIHLDYPWNPVELEQRVGRIHRLGSLNTVIVDAVIAEGTREIDMYHRARRRLVQILGIAPGFDANDLEAIERKFARTMGFMRIDGFLEFLTSEDIETAGQHFDEQITEAFNRFVTFETQVRANQQQVAELERGEADWQDLRVFARELGQARDGADVQRTTFIQKGDDIVAVANPISTMTLPPEGRRYFLADGAGLLDPEDGVEGALGLNLETLRKALQEQFAHSHQQPPAAIGALVVARKDVNQTLSIAGSDILPETCTGVLAALIQRVRVIGGAHPREEELDVRLGLWVVHSHGVAEAVQRNLVGPLARALRDASPQESPCDAEQATRIWEAEQEVMRPQATPEPLAGNAAAVQANIIKAHWPILAAALI